MSVTLQIINKFDSSVQDATDYFGSHYSDAEVWLYFLNTHGHVTYTDASSNATKNVVHASAIQLSTVKNGTFSLATDENSTKVFAGLGSSNPFSGKNNGPGIFDKDIPYALAEWTIMGNNYDNIDVSYIDSFSFPTTLTVKNHDGIQTGQAGFKEGTTASDVIKELSNSMSTKPTGPNNDNYPKPGQVGYGPLVPTVSGNSSANRWIGSSKYWISGFMNSGPTKDLRSMYLYAPSFQKSSLQNHPSYLQYLQTNEPTPATNSGNITGWYIDYSGNNGYSGYLSITGDADSGYGLKIHDIRVNTEPSAANDWLADPNAGDATKGEIKVAANDKTLVFSNQPPPKTTMIGKWTDAVIYSGAAVGDGTGGDPVVTGTDDFARDGMHADIVPTFLASISAAMATGLLGSNEYVTLYKNAANPKSTMYWFNTLKREEATQKLFDKAWPNGEKYYDPFWAVLAEYTNNEGYLSPFNDRWSNFSPDFSLGSGYSITWELGI